VCLTGDRVEMIFVETAQAGVVPEYRYHPGFLLLQNKRRLLDAFFEKAADCFGLAGRQIQVVEQAAKGIVIAVITAGLRDILQLQVSGIGKPDPRTFGLHARVQKVRADHRYVIGVEGQIAFIAQTLQRVITVDGKHAHRRHVIQAHLGNDDPYPLGRVPTGGTEDFPLLDDVVGQQLGGDAADLVFAQAAFYAVALGRIDRLIRPKPDSKQIFHGFDGRCAGIVTHPGPKTYPDDPVGVDRQRIHRRDLGDRVGKYFGSNSAELVGRQCRIDGHNIDRAHTVGLNAKVFARLAAQAFPFGVQNVRFQSYFNSTRHNMSTH